MFQQPGHGNSLYGTNVTVGNQAVNAVIPLNTVPTTTNLRDETGQNPNTGSRYITMYTRGGNYGTDQFDASQTYIPGQALWVMQDGTGRLTNQKPGTNFLQAGVVEIANDGNGFLQFKSIIV